MYSRTLTRPGRMSRARAERGSKAPAAPEGGGGGDPAGRLLVPRQWLHGARAQTPSTDGGHTSRMSCHTPTQQSAERSRLQAAVCCGARPVATVTMCVTMLVSSCFRFSDVSVHDPRSSRILTTNILQEGHVGVYIRYACGLIQTLPCVNKCTCEWRVRQYSVSRNTRWLMRQRQRRLCQRYGIELRCLKLPKGGPG
jgi:hypothetical protein